MTDSHKYIAYFDCNGFECVFNITAIESEYIMSALKGDTYQMPFNLHAMEMRARFNSYRNPEIWFFNVCDSLTEDDVKEMAESNPQYLADFIRKNGKNVYGKQSTAPTIV